MSKLKSKAKNIKEHLEYHFLNNDKNDWNIPKQTSLLKEVLNEVNSLCGDILDDETSDLVEVKSTYGSNLYKDWTRISRFLATGLVGVKIREIKDN